MGFLKKFFYIMRISSGVLSEILSKAFSNFIPEVSPVIPRGAPSEILRFLQEFNPELHQYFLLSSIPSRDPSEIPSEIPPGVSSELGCPALCVHSVISLEVSDFFQNSLWGLSRKTFRDFSKKFLQDSFNRNSLRNYAMSSFWKLSSVLFLDSSRRITAEFPLPQSYQASILL